MLIYHNVFIHPGVHGYLACFQSGPLGAELLRTFLYMFSVDTQTHFPWASVELEVELLAWITGLLNMSLDKIAFCLTAIILNK